MGRPHIDNTKYDNDGNNDAYDDSNDIDTNCVAYRQSMMAYTLLVMYTK